MKKSTSQLGHPGGSLSSRRWSRPAGRGFSRPAPDRKKSIWPRCVIEGDIESFAPNRNWMLRQLLALTLDCDRAWSYLAKPGCNVLLGMAQLARTFVKQSQVLRFLRDDPCRCDGRANPAVAFRRPVASSGRKP